MKEWKEECESTYDKCHLQLRDSWLPRTGAYQHGKGKRKGKASSSASKPAGKGSCQGKWKPRVEGGGPNTSAVVGGMHSCFSRQLQRVAGSKNIAEVILFTGRFDFEMLRHVAPGATQLVPQLSDRP